MSKTVIKNFTLHPIELSDDISDKYEIVEPDFDKKVLIIATNKIVSGEITAINEQHRILSTISKYVKKGDNILVAGHPLIVLTISIICSIKGARMYIPFIDIDTKKVIKIEQVLFDEKQLDRLFRYDIEHS